MTPYRTFPQKTENVSVKTPVSNLDKIAREITSRGNDVEVRTCREGIKIFEVTKKVVAVLPLKASE